MADATHKLSQEYAHTPQEVLFKVFSGQDQLNVGIPREIAFQENRVPLTPEAVSILTANGHTIVVESKAGDQSYFYDNDYANAGARIVYSKEDVYKSDIIVKIAPPSPEELEMMQISQTLISAIHLPLLKSPTLDTLIQKKIIALAYEYIKDESGAFPVTRSMSQIAGNAAILTAAEYLADPELGKGVLLGGIAGVSPAKVVIVGAGIVGEYAARAAMGMGAEVRIFDNSIYKLMRLQNLIGASVFTSIVSPRVLIRELKDADVAIGAVHSESGQTPVIVTEEMVSQMKAGSVVIDVSIDQGGIFETSEVTSHDKPTFKKYDVVHYCVPNIPSRVPRTASAAISNIIMPMLIECSRHGGVERLLSAQGSLRHGVYTYRGCLTNRFLSEKFKMKFTNIDLILATTL